MSWPTGGFGIVGLGDPGEPSSTETRPDLCADHDHPGCTYNPWSDKTWCLCGEVVTDGNNATHTSCCDGPLVAPISRVQAIEAAEDHADQTVFDAWRERGL